MIINSKISYMVWFYTDDFRLIFSVLYRSYQAQVLFCIWIPIISFFDLRTILSNLFLIILD